MEDTDLQCGSPKAEMAMVKAPGPSFNFSAPPKDSSKLIRRKKGRRKLMNLDSVEGEEEEEVDESGDRIFRLPKIACMPLFNLCRITIDVPGLFLLLNTDYSSLFGPFGLLQYSRNLRSLHLHDRIQIHPRQIRENVANVSVSAQWMFLLASLCLEIVSAVFEQVSSPRKPHFALIAMVLGILALLTCIMELFLKATKESVRLVSTRGKLRLFCHPPPCNRLFGTFSDVFGLLGVFFQLAFSIVQYTYLRRHVDNPIKVCFWPFLLIFCVAGSILIRNRRNTEDKHETGEHSA